MATKRKPTTVSAQLRQAIKDSGLTIYRVAKDARVGYSSVYRFMQTDQTISQDVFDALCAVMKLELRPRGDAP